MQRRYLNLIIILVLVIAAIWVDLPRAEGSAGLTLGSKHWTMNPVLGLDLRGGMQVLLSPQAGIEYTAQDLKDTASILESRANALGVSEVVFQIAGDKYILGEFPGLSNTQEVLASIKQTGLLEFVDAGDTQLAPGTVIKTDYGQAASETTTATVEATPEATPTEVATTDTTSSTESETIWHTVMTGAEIKEVSVSTGQTGGYVVDFTLTDEGAKIFSDYTTANVGKILSIVVDKTVLSSPVIETAITKGSGQISGSFTFESANNLAVNLRYGRLSVPVEIVESKVIGPSLGQDSINKSIRAGLIGFIIVALFMIIYYRLPGFMAVLSITVYALLTFALYKMIPVTLTLPGIAGFLLSTGSALDANILMFERMKEELRSGRNLKQAIDLGWKRAWPSIRDSNIATLITSVILYWFGSAYGASIVKGFAFTLAIGVIVSVFTAALVTRSFLNVTADYVKADQRQKLFGA